MEKLDHIIVNVADLYEQVDLMRKDGIKKVELMILPPQEDDGDVITAFLALSGLDPEDPSCSVDYDSIDAVDD